MTGTVFHSSIMTKKYQQTPCNCSLMQLPQKALGDTIRGNVLQSVLSIALYEIYSVAVACHLWSHTWSRQRLTVFCGNKATVGIINRGRSASPLIMSVMHRITWLAVQNDFIIKAEHIPSLVNTIADCLFPF